MKARNRDNVFFKFGWFYLFNLWRAKEHLAEAWESIREAGPPLLYAASRILLAVVPLGDVLSAVVSRYLTAEEIDRLWPCFRRERPDLENGGYFLKKEIREREAELEKEVAGDRDAELERETGV